MWRFDCFLPMCSFPLGDQRALGALTAVVCVDPEGLDLVLAEALRRLLTGGYEPAQNWRDAATS
jgi:hypothetical protein